eukprot:TRINITY_DN47562_c0_g1_i4.p2 TRINITY_DN47562_c0_g1~~TRINITY_DN47562_c0_g1_i4.p2  ORF type:complete len:115 (+),score=21.52 TRINITY_DN47562_c0_g1_i4:40-384(+)
MQNRGPKKGQQEPTIASRVGSALLLGVTTSLILKHLSAVAKAICSCISMVVFYVAYVGIGFQPINPAQACIVVIIIVSSYEYMNDCAMHREEQARKKDEKQGAAPTGSLRATGV